MKKVCVLMLVCVMSAGIVHAQYYVRGDFNSWGTDDMMVDDGDGTYSATVTGLTPGERYNFKVAVDDWSSSWPGSDSRIIANSAGEATFHFIPGAIGDGWNPLENRIGYDDPSQFGWDIMGSFDGWSAAIGQMTDNGGGMYSLTYTIATAGTYEFKFREAGSWDISIGGDFGNSAGNATVETLADNTDVLFELDLPNGRWNATVVPEPATMALLGLGSLAMLRRKK